jgi:anti-sigma B factor antagonist
VKIGHRWYQSQFCGGGRARSARFTAPQHQQDYAMAAGQRRIDVEQIGDVTVARFTDKKILDENNIQVIGNQLFGLVEEEGRKKVVLDFSNVEYLSSAALGKLITMDKKTKAAGGKLRLCSIRPDIYEVFAITKLNKLFDIRDDQEQALAGL